MTLVFPVVILTPSTRLTEISRAGSEIEGSSALILWILHPD